MDVDHDARAGVYSAIHDKSWLLYYSKMFFKDSIDRLGLHVNFDILVIFIFIYVFFGKRRESVIRFSYRYTINLNSLGHCICAQWETISAAAWLEPGTLGLWVNHAAKELSWCQKGSKPK